MLPEIDEMLRCLVQTPSISSTSMDKDQSNRAVIDLLANWLEDLGFAIEIQEVPSRTSKFNLLARRGSGEGGLVLSGHTDTVPCDEHIWQFDPFELHEHDGRYYGLGTCDMKGFFPIALAAAQRFQERDFQRPLTILATSDEEITMAGARHLAQESALYADAAVIGEPTEMQPVYAHKGIFTMTIQTEGSSGHSSNPSHGTSALEGMHQVMSVLMEFRRELQEKYRHHAFEVKFPTLNLGCLHGGDSANRICGQAELLIDMRIIPGMKNSDVIGEIERRLAECESRIDMPIHFDVAFPPVEPYEAPRDSGLLRNLEKLSGNRGGTVSFGTEAPFLQQLGIETIVFGPGSIDQAHQADEYLACDRIRPTQEILESLIGMYCCRESID